MLQFAVYRRPKYRETARTEMLENALAITVYLTPLFCLCCFHCTLLHLRDQSFQFDVREDLVLSLFSLPSELNLFGGNVS